MEWGNAPLTINGATTLKAIKCATQIPNAPITRDTRKTKEKGKKGKGDAATTNLAKGAVKEMNLWTP